MAVPHLILKLQKHPERESALQMLSSYLYAIREEKPNDYFTTGLLLCHSFGTMSILIEALKAAYLKIRCGNLTERAAMCLVNVISLIQFPFSSPQCIAANKNTRLEIVKLKMDNFLVHIVKFNSPLEIYDNVRAVVLSVFGIMCQKSEQTFLLQFGEPEVIRWAVQSDILDICWFSMVFENELTKVIALHILESVLKDNFGLSWFLSGSGQKIVRETLPHPLEDATYREILKFAFSRNITVPNMALW
ncbi:hypothetical protein CDL15_Pgr012603 [Punica granatum]|uniref:Uncharacterized protein n=1 Tax=Punica granatum TaxID=22663 RepID=A0A218XZ97_PUNGR|nr:hypothetical protein CDL15_Pgr012603 [Punica granatum]